MNELRRRLVDALDLFGMGNTSRIGQWLFDLATWIEPKK